MMVGFIGQFTPRDTRPADDTTIAITTSEPVRDFELELGDRADLRPATGVPTAGALDLPAEALLRLAAGRLAAGREQRCGRDGHAHARRASAGLPRLLKSGSRGAHRPPLGSAAVTYLAADDRYDQMTYRRCGRSGVHLPAVSLGLWHNFGDDRPLDGQRAILRRAFDLGITHFDLANNYGPPYGVGRGELRPHPGHRPRALSRRAA